MNGTRLTGVLRVRRIQERRARGEVATRRRDHRLASTAETTTWTLLDGALASVTSAPATALLGARAVVDAGVLAAQTQNRATAEAATRVGEAAARWTLAARRVEGLERLAGRLAEDEHAEQQRTAANEVDDLVLARWNRRSR